MFSRIYWALPDGCGRLLGGDLTRRRGGIRLAPLRWAHTETQLARPRHLALVGGHTVGRRRPHPGRRVALVARPPVLPRLGLGHALVVHEEFVAGVHGVSPVGEGELEELGLGDRLRGAGLHTEVAVDAAQVVDLVDEAVALTG